MAEKQQRTAKAKGPGKPFKPGQSGNPKGRPKKGYSLAEFIRGKLEEDDGAKLERLFESMYVSATDQGDIQAGRELFTRAYGKPIDTIQLDASHSVNVERTERPQLFQAMLTHGSTTGTRTRRSKRPEADSPSDE